jgi:hypothetical protein
VVHVQLKYRMFQETGIRVKCITELSITEIQLLVYDINRVQVKYIQ